MAISAAEYSRRLNTLLRGDVLADIVEELLIKDEETIQELKKQDYLEGDIYGDGQSYATYRSRAYREEKMKKNPLAGGKVDLIYSGKFVKSLNLSKRRKNAYRFISRVSYAPLLSERYGDIFSLNKKVFEKYQIEILKPRFATQIKRYAKIQ